MADRRLLARLVLIREELRAMMAGGIHDPRANTRVLGNLPQKEVRSRAVIRMIGRPFCRSSNRRHACCTFESDCAFTINPNNFAR